MNGMGRETSQTSFIKLFEPLHFGSVVSLRQLTSQIQKVRPAFIE